MICHWKNWSEIRGKMVCFFNITCELSKIRGSAMHFSQGYTIYEFWDNQRTTKVHFVHKKSSYEWSLALTPQNCLFSVPNIVQIAVSK